MPPEMEDILKRTRSLGLVAVLALALVSIGGVASASAAGSAGLFVADYYPSDIEGINNELVQLEFPASGPYGYVGCSSSSLDGGTVEGSSSKLALDAAFESCTTFPNTKKTVKMNGCKLTFHPGAPGSGDTFDIGPAGCGPITLTGGYCEFKVGAQNGLDANIENITKSGTEFVRLEAEADDMDYTPVGGPSGCHSGSLYGNGQFRGSWDVGASLVGNLIDLHLAAGGLALAGKASEVPAEQPRLEAPAYQAPVAGEQAASDPLVFGFKDGVTGDCDSSTFSGSLSAASNTLKLSAAYAECTIAGFAGATVKMNGCAFRVNVLNVGPPYAGKVDIECAEAGQKIDIQAAACRFKIGAQTGIESVGLANSAGTFGEVTADLDLKGIKYEATDGFLCPLKGGGEFSDGTYSGTMLLSLG